MVREACCWRQLMDISNSNVGELADLAELEFSAITPEDAVGLDDRVYLLGVRPEFVIR